MAPTSSKSLRVLRTAARLRSTNALPAAHPASSVASEGAEPLEEQPSAGAHQRQSRSHSHSNGGLLSSGHLLPARWHPAYWSGAPASTLGGTLGGTLSGNLRGTSNITLSSSLSSLLQSCSFSAGASALAGAGAARGRAQAQAEEVTYARGLIQYNTVLKALSDSGKAHLLRDAYDDMIMDGVAPTRATFHWLVVGCKRKRRLQDALFFYSEMKRQGIAPDVIIYNCIILCCAHSGHIHQAFRIAEEMEVNGCKLGERTYTSLVTACGRAGKVAEADGVVERMLAEGMSLNRYAYAYLITAHYNAFPRALNAKEQVFQLLEKARVLARAGQISHQSITEGLTDDGSPGAMAAPETVEGMGGGAHGNSDEGWRGEAEGEGEVEVEVAGALHGDENEEGGSLYGESGEEGLRKEYEDPNLVAYRAGLRAMAAFKDVEGAKRIFQFMEEDSLEPDVSSRVLLVHTFIAAKDIEGAMEALEDLLQSTHRTRVGGQPIAKLMQSLMTGALEEGPPKGFELAKELLAKYEARGDRLGWTTGSGLLQLAARDKSADFSCAKAFFDSIAASSRSPNILPPKENALVAFIHGLRDRNVPDDDPRLLEALEILRQFRAQRQGRARRFS